MESGCVCVAMLCINTKVKETMKLTNILELSDLSTVKNQMARHCLPHVMQGSLEAVRVPIVVAQRWTRIRVSGLFNMHMPRT